MCAPDRVAGERVKTPRLSGVAMLARSKTLLHRPSVEFAVSFGRAYELISAKLRHWAELLVRMLPNLVLAILVFVLAVIAGRVLRRIAREVLRRTHVPDTVASIIDKVLAFVALAMGLFVALSILQLDKTVTSLLAGAGVIGLALSFAFQDLASNFISGLLITLQRPLRVGDLVKTKDYMGRVLHIGLRSVTLRDFDGQDIIIPSKDVFQNPLINFSMDPGRRINLEVGVSYASDLEHVERVAKEAVSALEVVAKNHPVDVHWQAFGESSIDFTLRFWIADSDQRAYNEALSKAVKAIKVAFDANEITIPFPIRTLDFDPAALRQDERGEAP